MPETIVIIEDDESIREMLRYYFRSVGYEVGCFESGEAYFETGGELKPSLFILDIMLPGMDGLEILRRLQADADLGDVPVLMLTARTSEMDKVKGLEGGADDYVVKPFGIMELQARVKALLRRTGRPRSEAVITCGDLEIDPAAREVRKTAPWWNLRIRSLNCCASWPRGAAWYSRGTISSRRCGTTTLPARPAQWICM